MEGKRTLDNMLWVFLPYVTKLVAEAEKIDMDTALNFVYGSKIYKMLEDKNCKMWYYSDKMLAEFFIKEYEEGNGC